MKSSRRSFIRNSSAALLAPAVLLSDFDSTIDRRKIQATDWEYIRSLFPITSWSKIHFNSGSAGVLTNAISDYTSALLKEQSARAPYEVWSGWQEIRNENLSRLALLCGTSPDEVRLTRNTTESLNDIIGQIKLNPNDEILYAEHDYPYAHNAILNRAQRDQLKARKIKVDLSIDDQTIIEQYKQALKPSTKLLHLTHITHRQGQVLPIKAIAQYARSQGTKVLVDGAHVVGHIPLNIESLGVDYYASSLHKWLNAAHGTGMIYVNKDILATLHPFSSSYESDHEGIRQFDHLGTRAFYIEIALKAALDMHDDIGAEIKLARLNELTTYWIDQAQKEERFKLHTRPTEYGHIAVASFSIDGVGAGQILKILDEKYNIHAKTVGSSWGSAVRISTNIFTSYPELDQLVEGIKFISANY